MTAPGWYKDPAEPDVRRYWDGEQWIGDGIPADAVIPSGPPVDEKPRYGAEESPVDAMAPAQLAGSAWEAPAGGRLGAPPEGGRTPGYPTLPGFPPAGGAGLPLGALPGDVPKEGLASLGERLAARVLDIVFVTLLNIVVNGWFVYQYFRPIWPTVVAAMQAAKRGQVAEPVAPSESVSWLWLVILLIAIALWFAYEVPSVWNSGQTLGKRLIGIRVQFLLDHPLTFALSMRRWWIQALTVICWPLGAIWGLVDALWCTWDQPRKQCVHDKAAFTIVVRNSAPRPDGQTKNKNGEAS